MSENVKRRILVVEDVPDLSDSYKFHLERAGFLVDIVDRKIDAIDALKAKIYDVALVDLQLKDDITHKGGIDVLDAMNDLNDGTVAIVVSGTHEIQESIASYRRGIADFIMKGDIRSKDLIAPIDKALATHRRPHFGDFPSLSAYLAAPQVTPIWEGHVEPTIGCGYQNLHKLLWGSLQPYLPLIRKKDGSPSLLMDKGRRAVAGLFWSKNIGSAIWFSAAATEMGSFIEPDDPNAERIGNFSVRDAVGAVWKVKTDRKEFLERISDRPWSKK
jgi:ActR/RegA family two-component response regulator